MKTSEVLLALRAGDGDGDGGGTPRPVGRAMLLRGEIQVEGDTVKTLTVQLPELPGQDWDCAWLGYSVMDFNSCIDADKPGYLLAGVISLAGGNENICGYNNAKMSGYSVFNNAGAAGYYNAGTVLSYSKSDNSVQIGYNSSSRTLYFPPGSTVEWYALMTGPQETA